MQRLTAVIKPHAFLQRLPRSMRVSVRGFLVTSEGVIKKVQRSERAEEQIRSGLESSICPEISPAELHHPPPLQINTQASLI
ncbi:Interferon alpha/beta receptor 1a [Dissostichus eleginoides]|uniref:Interferon alpha/beta receptor 1a n=1 Tax=Dissostichus eleginoides TaxID=100907 RepID=A0AAD9F1V7_DISEL|nr:Interferon alpha/beta receptor 1a [Dissostichus eleginoides]